jgi:hypothetical protein
MANPGASWLFLAGESALKQCELKIVRENVSGQGLSQITGVCIQSHELCQRTFDMALPEPVDEAGRMNVYPTASMYLEHNDEDGGTG